MMTISLRDRDRMARGHRQAEEQVLLLADGEAVVLQGGWLIPLKGVALQMSAHVECDLPEPFEARVWQEITKIVWESIERIRQIHTEAPIEVNIEDILCDIDPFTVEYEEILDQVRNHLLRGDLHANR